MKTTLYPTAAYSPKMPVYPMVIFLFLFFISNVLLANSYVSTEKQAGSFELFADGAAAPIVYNSNDYPGIAKIAALFQKDILMVTHAEPKVFQDDIPAGQALIIIGTLGKSILIDELIKNKKIDVTHLQGKWETFNIQVVENPYPNVQKALVITGSDKRGTIFGMFDVSLEIGVSPWHWWADAAPQTKSAIYIQPGIHTKGTPKVKYRGIFINDEAPALSGWVAEKYGDFNHKFYEKVFELILRLKGNYLWPAMWGRAIYDDDSLSAPLANEMGVVIGTSHHEPLMRAHVEWSRYGKGDWNYESNPAELREFWKEGLLRMGDNESVVTIGMRGDGDQAMAEGTAIELLERIVNNQRAIIEQVTGKPAEETTQAWALYKEVQDYYDKGMRVPEDVILLLCDDNWGNVRVLPKKEDWDRKGGFGIYYHFDFVGGPVSYKWLNVTQIEKVWEQMNLSYQWHARELWLVNVGDIKPMELPISFFLDFAWDPETFTADKLTAYYSYWAEQQFGPGDAQEIAEILSLYTKYNARRTPEMLKADTYSLFDYGEAEKVVSDYNNLLKRSTRLYNALPQEAKASYFQLVQFPVEMCANLNEMYLAVAKNNLYATQERASTNIYAQKVRAHFEKDAALTKYFHEEMLDGKWNHIMSQTHIGYSSWRDPKENIMPEVAEYNPPQKSALGIMVEGSNVQGDASLPRFDSINNQKYYIELFNKGNEPAEYTIVPQEKWIIVSNLKGLLKNEEKIYISIDWDKAPAAESNAVIDILDVNDHFEVNVTALKTKLQVAGFIENNKVVSIEAAHFKKAVNGPQLNWLIIPNMGRTASAVQAQPANFESFTLSENSPHLEYEFTVFEAGDAQIQVYLSPTLNFKKENGLKFAVSIDDEAPVIINMHEGEDKPDWEYPLWWNNSVTDHIKIKTSQHTISSAGKHILKLWAIDPGIVFQKIVIDGGGLKPSYLGPPASLNFKM